MKLCLWKPREVLLDLLRFIWLFINVPYEGHHCQDPPTSGLYLSKPCALNFLVLLGFGVPTRIVAGERSLWSRFSDQGRSISRVLGCGSLTRLSRPICGSLETILTNMALSIAPQLTQPKVRQNQDNNNTSKHILSEQHLRSRFHVNPSSRISPP